MGVGVGWVNAEHEFRVWVTILGCMSRHFQFKITDLFCNIFKKASKLHSTASHDPSEIILLFADLVLK